MIGQEIGNIALITIRCDLHGHYACGVKPERVRLSDADYMMLRRIIERAAEQKNMGEKYDG